MWRLNLAIVLLLGTYQVHGQIGNGYNYNKPDKSFGGAQDGIGPIQGAAQGPSRPQGGTSGYPSVRPSVGLDLLPSTRPTQVPTGADQIAPSGYPSGRPQQGTRPQAPGSVGYPSGPTVPSQQPPPSGAFRPDGRFPDGASPGFPSGPQGGPGTGFIAQGGPVGQLDGQGFVSPGLSQGPAFESTGRDDGFYDEGDYSAIPGTPDLDYPILSEIPETSFRCDAQQFPGYYADVETRCQVFHVCANNKTYDFLCPNGTIFHQEYLVCVWWNQFDCNSALSLYGINENIYDYLIVGAQQPGGFSGNVQGQYYDAQGPGGATGPQPSFPGQQVPSGPSGPSTTFPGQRPPQVSSTAGYPSQRPQGPGTQDLPPAPVSYPSGTAAPYPSQQGPTGQQTGQAPPGSRGPQISGQQPTGAFQGYPSDRPSYPSLDGSFPSGQLGPQGSQGAQPRPQQPTREYLPPVNG